MPKPKDQLSDALLDMMIEQGYVKKGCSMKGQLVWMLVQAYKAPCVGCNCDRTECRVPKTEEELRGY